MNSKSLVVVLCLALLVSVAMGVVYLRGSRTVVVAPGAKVPTPAEIKAIVALLNGSIEDGPFGMNVKANAAEKLGDLGQAAKDAGAIPELTRLSRNRQVKQITRDAATAALARLNAAPPAAP